jgi:glycosyltransferase involved in cell wall biosynthesis
MWIDQLYSCDRERVALLESLGAVVNQARRPRRWLLRLPDRLLQRPPQSVRELVAFGPDAVIVAVGMHAPEDEASWRLKKSMTDAARAVGAKIVIQHQYAAAGEWVANDGVSGEWLEWQRSADWHQFVSHATWRETEENFGFTLQGEIIRNNYNVPHDGELPWPEGPALRMAFVGRFGIWQKGLDLLLEAVSLLSKVESAGWELTLLGGGEMAPRLQAEVSRRGLDDRVKIEGHRTDIHGIWKHHHMLVMPSRAEGLSLALTEAMLCGRPAIASMVAGTGELLDDGVNGFACYLDAGHLAEKMREAIALHRGGSLRHVGRAAAAKARQVFPPNPEEVYLDQLIARLGPNS